MPKITDLDRIVAEITERSRIPDWKRMYPWWPRPVHVKVLFYADGSIQYDGGPFYGLKQVLATLQANHYPWVRFDVTTAHRRTDPSADHDGLDLASALALDAFDELWIYSAESTPVLSAAELHAAQTFMDTRKGGVLITGDHADLGAAFGNLPRAGKMRQLPAPPAAPPDWNTTLREGANTLFEFEDQSDAYPQPLSLKWYWAGPFKRVPHPVLCSPFGPIDIFPDHQHEGEALAPPPASPAEWPAGAVAAVIASGSIVDPSSNTPGRHVGVLSAYNGHAASVGRILADSTWHHHFDINLRGIPGNPSRTGFVNPGTADFLPAARKIEYYFVNAGVWLAPPIKQAHMRAAAWWPVLWSNEVFEAQGLIDQPALFGRQVCDALGRFAPSCARFHFVWDLLPESVRHELIDLAERGTALPVTEHLAAAATQQLIEKFKLAPGGRPVEAPPHEEIARVLEGSVERAMDQLQAEQEQRLKSLRKVSSRVKDARARE